MSLAGLSVIGERINPGFRSTKALFDTEDMAGIQALAVRQAQAGASYLNVNVGTKALEDPQFMVDVVRHIQAVVDLPLSLDCPDLAVQKVVLKAYDADKARGCKPIINSISESRWELSECLHVRPCKVILMSSEQRVDGRVVASKTGHDVHESSRSMVRRIKVAHPNMANDDFLIDVSVSTLAADTEGLIQMALEGVGLIHNEPELNGAHIMGGLSNLGQHLPPKAGNGLDLVHQIECAFLTMGIPLGFDTVLGTPWRGYELLPEDNFVLKQFQRIIGLRDSEALASVIDLYLPAE
ncbi:MAG: dihydropteroate synthase [Ferrovum sp.]|nr:dihydropteroate synthase [Ferrovum sp.]